MVQLEFQAAYLNRRYSRKDDDWDGPIGIPSSLSKLSFFQEKRRLVIPIWNHEATELH